MFSEMVAVAADTVAVAADTSDLRPGIPGAPIEMRVDPTKHAVFTVICGVPAVAVVLLAMRSAIKTRDLVWPLFLTGGTVAMFVEPILDYLGGVWWPYEGSWEAFTMLGVNIPWFVPLVYPWLIGAQAYVAYRAFQRGATWRQTWYLVAAFAATDIVLETIGLRLLGAYAYFGTQPLDFWGLPLWYVPCNAIGPLFIGAMFYVLRDRLAGVRALGSVGLFPFGFLGVYCAAGFPVWISLNSGWPMWAAVLCSLWTFAISYLLVVLVAEMVGARSAAGRRPMPSAAAALAPDRQAV